MAKGIGIRYGMKGLRALEIERSFLGLSITGAASSRSGEDCGAFLSRLGFDKDAPVAIGLVPGDFLSAYMTREKHMDDTDMENHLKWEIQQKMISDPAGFNYDFVISKNAGFMFACRKMIIDTARDVFGKAITDVEPVALLNGCEGADEVRNGTCVLISAEAEGISSVVLEEGNPVAVESFPIQLEVCPEKDGGETARQVAEYIYGSLCRLTSLGEDKKKPAPGSLVLAGGGANLDEISVHVGNKTGIDITVSDPFRSQKVELALHAPSPEHPGTAFTTCLGLALRAIEG